MKKSVLFGFAALAAISLPALSHAAPRSGEVRELRCDLMETDGRRVQVIEARDLRVLRDTALAGQFDPGLPQDTAGILCSRNSIIPAAYDDEAAVIVPLHIAERGSPGRLGVLEIERGHYRFRIIQGAQPSAAEQVAIDARLAEFQARAVPVG